MTYFHRSTDIVNRGSVVGIILLQIQILIDDKNVKSDFKKLKNQVFKYEELTERYSLVTFGKDVTILFPVKKTDQNDVNNIFIICLSIPYLRFEKKIQRCSYQQDPLHLKLWMTQVPVYHAK